MYAFRSCTNQVNIYTRIQSPDVLSTHVLKNLSSTGSLKSLSSHRRSRTALLAVDNHEVPEWARPRDLQRERRLVDSLLGATFPKPCLDDVLPALPAVPRRSKSKPASARTASQRVPASEQRPTRVTRSAANAAVKKVGTVLNTAKTTKANGPNKIPRLANGTSARGTATSSKETAPAPAAPTTTRPLRPRQPGSPTPSRLPTLVGAKRSHHNSTGSVQESGATVTAIAKSALAAAGTWVATNAGSVVVPASKSERPGLRSIFMVSYSAHQLAGVQRIHFTLLHFVNIYRTLFSALRFRLCLTWSSQPSSFFLSRRFPMYPPTTPDSHLNHRSMTINYPHSIHSTLQAIMLSSDDLPRIYEDCLWAHLGSSHSCTPLSRTIFQYQHMFTHDREP
ncbi:hypothetical protein NUW54_g12967 [Trametes sanguinea]|uniref:Uncharacterized protein n=1 Tax=Trametes sanguinea TaxID=158606 RepID=A0ACC1MS34_9APHY|nr:hypothetical protein NUW54_g12967 [Trametes sanguinea]